MTARYDPSFYRHADPGCAVCGDFRFVYTPGYGRETCPNCGCSCPEHKPGTPRSFCEGDRKSEDLKLRAYIRNHGMPELTEGALSKREKEIVAEWRARFPRMSMLTFLAWIEGQRYTPSAAEKDKTFQLELAIETANWKSHREAHEGQ